ncbi:MAG TPA: tetratricopeptide repeat protein [Chroococcales cyanobacterium]
MQECVDLQLSADRAFDQADYNKAEQLFKTILKKEQSGWFLGHQFNDFKLADALEKQRKFDEAEKVYIGALRTLEKRHGDGSELVTCLQNLAIFYWMQRRYGEAEPLFRRALQLHRLHDHTWESILCREDYAQLLRATNRTENALTLEQEAKTIRAEFINGVNNSHSIAW